MEGRKEMPSVSATQEGREAGKQCSALTSLTYIHVGVCMYFHIYMYTNTTDRAQIFAACSQGLRELNAVARSSRRRVRPGKFFTYTITISSTTTTTKGSKGKVSKTPLDLEGLELRVVLPPNTRMSTFKMSPKPPRGRPFPQLMDGVVTLALSRLRGRSKWKFSMKIFTAFETPAPFSLTVSASVIEANGAGLDICPRAANDVTVAVV
jgi:hypothetical protein